MKPTLEELKNNLDRFLAQGGKRRSMSHAIKRMAVEALRTYTHIQVADTLGISKQTLYNWEKALAKKTAPQFVELDAGSMPQQQAMMQMTVPLPPGACLLVPYQSCEQIKQLFSLLAKASLT